MKYIQSDWRRSGVFMSGITLFIISIVNFEQVNASVEENLSDA